MGFSNILATDNMVAIKNGKVIVSGSGDNVHYYYASQDEVDVFIAEELTFGEVLADNRLHQAMIQSITFDDQEPVTADKRVDVATIARNSEIFIYVEPQFVRANPHAAYTLEDVSLQMGGTAHGIFIDGKLAIVEVDGVENLLGANTRLVQDPSYFAGMAVSDALAGSDGPGGGTKHAYTYPKTAMVSPDSYTYEILGDVGNAFFPV